jgi:uncharacterized membrane protein YbhN (UPF0104 family)
MKQNAIVQTASRRVLRGGLSLLMTTGCCAVLGVYLYAHRESLSTVSVHSPSQLTVCIAALTGSLLTAGPIFSITTTRVGSHVGVVESTCLAVLGTALNAIVPLHGGAAARGLYLKRFHNLDLTDFAATFLGYNILRLLVAAIAALCACLWLVLLGQSNSSGLTACLLISACCSLGALALCLFRPEWLSKISPIRFHGLIKQFHNGWTELMRGSGFFIATLALVALQITFECMACWAAWGAIGLSLPVSAVVLVTCLGILTALTGLTPNGLGLVELVSVAVGTVVAVEPTHGIAAGLLIRTLLMGILLVGSPVCLLLIYLIRRSTPPT